MNPPHSLPTRWHSYGAARVEPLIIINGTVLRGGAGGCLRPPLPCPLPPLSPSVLSAPLTCGQLSGGGAVRRGGMTSQGGKDGRNAIAHAHAHSLFPPRPPAHPLPRTPSFRIDDHDLMMALLEKFCPGTKEHLRPLLVRSRHRFRVKERAHCELADNVVAIITVRSTLARPGTLSLRRLTQRCCVIRGNANELSGILAPLQLQRYLDQGKKILPPKWEDEQRSLRSAAVALTITRVPLAAPVIACHWQCHTASTGWGVGGGPCPAAS